MVNKAYGDPERDVRAMRNHVDVHVTFYGISEKDRDIRRETARKLLDHCGKTGISGSESESFREMAIGLLDFRSWGKNTAVSYSYQTDAGALQLDPLAGATACLPEEVTAQVLLTKNTSEVKVSEDKKDVGYWNCIRLSAEKGNWTKQEIGHIPAGKEKPDEKSFHEIEPGNFGSTLEELGYMAMAFSSREAALEQQKQRQAESIVQRAEFQDEEEF